MAEKTAFEIGAEVSAAVIAAGAYVYLAGGSVLWARYAALDLPASTAVSSQPRSLLFVTGATSLLAPLTVFSVAIVLGLSLKLLDTWKKVVCVFGTALFASVILETLASRDGVISSSQTLAVFAVTSVIGAALVIVLALMGKPEVAGILLAALAALVVLDDQVVPTVAVVIIGVALLGSAGVVADASTARSTAWLAVPIVAAAVLLVRLLFEFQSPAPLAPTVVYGTQTRPCATPEKRMSEEPLCPTAGYLIAHTDDRVLLAAVKGPRAQDVRAVRCTRRVSGLMVTLPGDSVAEVQVLGREQVAAPGATTNRTLFDLVVGLDTKDFERHGCD
jgi:hypothetical protein